MTRGGPRSALVSERTAVFHQSGLAFGLHPDPSFLARRRAAVDADMAELLRQYDADVRARCAPGRFRSFLERWRVFSGVRRTSR